MAPPRRTVSHPTVPSVNPIQVPPNASLQRHNSEPIVLNEYSIRNHVKLSTRVFDVNTLPEDLLRVYYKLEADHDEEYALTFCFIVRTAVELHRAWHMTLLTSKILQMVKNRFGIRCTWNLGVIRLIFRADDGTHELHRKVPYDYDSEYQDLYFKIAVALCEGHITIHEALIYQSETKAGFHTAPSGKFFRVNPGRLLLYPLEAATCAVIFFGGDWMDAAVAAICGTAAGGLEWAIGAMSNYFGNGQISILVDICAGLITGIIGGLFYRFYEAEQFCLSSIFLGTLYWFFYGTAFVLGLLEIIAGELETGVTRFIAVSIKTFVLTMSACIGLMIAVEENVYEAWNYQYQDNVDACNTIDLDSKWWRIPLYLLCSASALGQYRFPVANYWRGLIVQLVGYEVQYQVYSYLAAKHVQDFLDTAASNIAGAAAAVVVADILRYIIDEAGRYYTARLLDRELPDSVAACFFYNLNVFWLKMVGFLHLGRKTQQQQLQLQRTLHQSVLEVKDPNHPRKEIELSDEEEKALVEAIVEGHGLNLWSLLMPAVYQLVPGSMIAKLWFNAIFPPQLVSDQNVVGGSQPSEGLYYVDRHADPRADDVFYGLMVVSLSLAIGLIIGQAITGFFTVLFAAIGRILKPNRKESVAERENRLRREKFHAGGVMEMDDEKDLDPDGDLGGRTNKKTDEPIPSFESKRQLVIPEFEESAKTATTYAPAEEANGNTNGASVRLRPMNAGQLVAVAENDEANGVAAMPSSLQVQMDNGKMADDEGFEISGEKAMGVEDTV